MQHLAGKLIVFDGGEGGGKTTQARLLQAALEEVGSKAIVVRDPGTTHIGEMIRGILLNPENAEMAMRCEMLLYMAARAQMMRETIEPALAEGKVVISDRFVSSTLSYQLGGDGLTAADIRAVANVAIRGRWPDLTLILDMPVELSIARVKREKDRIEQRSFEYHAQVRRNYLAQVAEQPTKYRLIDANRSPEKVHADVMAAMEALA